ncbi:inositol monophosphatase [Alsobacter sp. SYSU M60028]|uniref:Inositol-1-monophosphatase n=1 Tax=Alsobacter ponti TaxID=2962936 RepID=A0ABT1LCJ5_9HYPH|nr:inositol monophosphatase family protein [Alsobacter ponti]MCP8937968.1 inositol monophosphatase [Alsobacter ponti]
MTTTTPATAGREANPRLRAACEVALEAGALALARFRDKGSIQVSFKGHQDYLTEVDGLVERLIIERLSARFPEDGFIGEEGGGSGSARVWVIDPIDGTSNFARGIGHFCVSIAYVDDRGPALGVIYDPTRDELFAAERGGGATLNGAPIAVSGIADPRRASVECGWSMRRPIGDYIALMGRVAEMGAGLYRLGSGALGMAYVAAGRTDAYCELHINSWDVLAGLVIVAEAGGAVSDFTAGDYLANGNPVLACSPALAEKLARATGIPMDRGQSC